MTQEAQFLKNSSHYFYTPARTFVLLPQEDQIVIGYDDGSLNYVDQKKLISVFWADKIASPLSGVSYTQSFEMSPPDPSYLTGTNQKFLPDVLPQSICNIDSGNTLNVIRFENRKNIVFSPVSRSISSSFYDHITDSYPACGSGMIFGVRDFIITLRGDGSLCRWGYNDPQVPLKWSLHKTEKGDWSPDRKLAKQKGRDKYGVKKILPGNGPSICNFVAAHWEQYSGTGVSPIPNSPPFEFEKPYPFPNCDKSFFTSLQGEKKEKEQYDRYQTGNIYDAVSWTPEGKEPRYILLDRDGKLSAIRQSDGKPADFPQIGKGPKEGMTLAMVPDQTELVMIGWDKSVYAADLTAEKPEFRCIFESVGTQAFSQIAVHPNSRQWAVASEDGTIRFWDRSAKKEQISADNMLCIGPKVRNNSGKLRYSSDGRFLIQAGENNLIVLWDTESLQGYQRISVKTNPNYSSMYNSIDGLETFIHTHSDGSRSEMFVCGGADGGLYFYRLMLSKGGISPEYHLVFSISSHFMQTFAKWNAVIDICVDEKNNLLYVGTLNSLLAWDLSSIMDRINSLDTFFSTQNIKQMTGLHLTSDRKFILNDTVPKMSN